MNRRDALVGGARLALTGLVAGLAAAVPVVPAFAAPKTDPELDRALGAREAMRTFMTQDSSERVCLSDALRRLADLAAEV